MVWRFGRDTRGNLAILAGLVLSVLGTSIGLAVDYANLARERTELQGVADAAALAAVKSLADSIGSPDGTREQAASTVAAQFVNARAPKAQQSISASASSNAATVRLTVDQPLWFGGLLARSSSTVSVTSVASYNNPKPCMIALGPSEAVGISLTGSASINAPKCSVWSNATSASSITMQGAPTLIALQACAAGGVGQARGNVKNCGAAADPYQGRTVASTCGSKSTQTNCDTGKSLPGASTYTGNCDYTDESVGASTKVTKVYGPGPVVFCGGLTIKSADVVLLPGVYQMQDGPLSLQGNASLSGNGVTILLSGVGAVLDLQGSPSMTISGMTSGAYAGFAIVSKTSATPVLTSTLQGSPELTVTGSIYLPNQRFDMQGSPRLTQLGASDTLAALSFALQGSPDIVLKADSSSSTTSGLRLTQ